MTPLNIQFENNENLVNFIATCVIPVTITLIAILVSSLICNTYTKNDTIPNNISNESESNNDDDEDDDTPSEKNVLDSDTSDDDENDNSNNKLQYSSVMYRSFSHLNKKQLIKMTGQKHKNKNKNELIVIAMYKFMIKSIEKSDSLPKGIKVFAIANKKIMKQELLELYEIPSDETSEDEKETIQSRA